MSDCRRSGPNSDCDTYTYTYMYPRSMWVCGYAMSLHKVVTQPLTSIQKNIGVNSISNMYHNKVAAAPDYLLWTATPAEMPTFAYYNQGLWVIGTYAFSKFSGALKMMQPLPLLFENKKLICMWKSFGSIIIKEFQYETFMYTWVWKVTSLKMFNSYKLIFYLLQIKFYFICSMLLDNDPLELHI